MSVEELIDLLLDYPGYFEVSHDTDGIVTPIKSVGLYNYMVKDKTEQAVLLG